jgi:hypothetical protein
MKKFTILKKINEGQLDSMSSDQQVVISSGTQSVGSTQSSSGSNESSDLSDPVKFFSKLFESKEMAHMYHLQVKGDDGSHAAHLALGQYYEEVPKLIDELIEVYMGQYDVVEGYDIIDTNVSKNLNPLEYFMGIGEFVKSERYSAISESDTHLHSIIDVIVSLIYRLTYKLKYNK